MRRIDPQLLRLMRTLGVRAVSASEHDSVLQDHAWFDEPVPFGMYFPDGDKLFLNRDGIEAARHDVNLVMAHELVHATGHRSRLARPGIVSTMRLTTTKQHEEVVAEVGAVRLLDRLGLRLAGQTEELGEWIRYFLPTLGRDRIADGIRRADQAVSYLLTAEMRRREAA